MGRHSAAVIGELSVVLPRGIDAIWSTILALDEQGPWATMDVAGASHQGKKETYAYVLALIANGHIEQAGERASRIHMGPATVPLYRLRRRLMNAPRFGRDGKPAKISGQQQVWNAMRTISGGFDYRELALAASTDETLIAPSAAKTYLKHLLAAGYLNVVRPAKGNVPAVLALKQSVKNRPLAPQIMRTKYVWDPNIRSVVGNSEMSEEVRL